NDERRARRAVAELLVARFEANHKAISLGVKAAFDREFVRQRTRAANSGILVKHERRGMRVTADLVDVGLGELSVASRRFFESDFVNSFDHFAAIGDRRQSAIGSGEWLEGGCEIAADRPPPLADV